MPAREAAPGQGRARCLRADSLDMDDLVHEIRQPLGVIESLAHYLQMISTEPQVSQHLQTIRSMVVRVNLMLEGHSRAS